MNQRILLLDIDGCLNKMIPHPNGYFGTDKDNVETFNHFLGLWPDLKIVISSSWRYLIQPHLMTLQGFESLLLTHGVDCKNRIVGRTPLDEEWGDGGAW